MQERCEVCQNFRPFGERPAHRRFLEVRLDERVVVLCRAHALIAQNSDVTSLADLRELYHESDGNRSYVPRRATDQDDDRRSGRRATDLRG